MKKTREFAGSSDDVLDKRVTDPNANQMENTNAKPTLIRKEMVLNKKGIAPDPNGKPTLIQRKEGKEFFPESIPKPFPEKLLQEQTDINAGIGEEKNANAKQTQRTNGKPTQDEMASCTNAKQTEIQGKENDEKDLRFITEPFTVKGFQDKKVSDPNAEPTENTNGKQTQDKRDSDPGEQTLTKEECVSAPSIADEIAEYAKSEFITAISEKVEERGYDERFITLLQYWPRQEAELIGKINKYLRCLLESTLKLSRYRNIPATDLLNLANAYTHVIYSQDFEKSGHPYYEALKSLHKKLSQVYRDFKNSTKLRLVLSREDKVELITMLHEIGNSVPLYKFSELFKEAKR